MMSLGVSEFAWLLILAGFVLAFIAAILMVVFSVRGRGRVKGGGVVLLGPIPIIFGTDKSSAKLLFALGLILTVVLVLLWVSPYMR